MSTFKSQHENTRTEGGLSVVEDTRQVAKLPSLYQVLLLNDDYTPMEFVIEVLQKFFDKTQSEAAEITLNVHHKGRGTCGVFPFDIAETKTAMVNEYSRRNQHPLQCVYEKA